MAKNELKTLRHELDDTLILLAEQDAKLSSYKQKLRVYNEPVSDDEDLVNVTNDMSNNHVGNAHENIHFSNV